MYSKGQQGLRNLDLELASLRQGALKEIRATREEVRRAMILEDVRRQNKERQGQQPLLHSVSCSSVQGKCAFGAADVMSTSKSIGCNSYVNSDNASDGLAKGKLMWYDGFYTASQDNDTNGDAYDKKGHEEEEEDVVVDITERVSQAVTTLYPTLLAEVVDCTMNDDEEKKMKGGELVVGSNEVVEWDDRGAPVRLRTMYVSNSLQEPAVWRRPETEQKSFVRNETVSPGRSSEAMSTTGTSDFYENICNRPYEYKPRDSPFGPVLLTGAQKKRHPSSSRVGSNGAVDKGVMRPLQYQTPSCPNRSKGTRSRNRPQLYTEGIAVAESSASAIATRIRNAVLARQKSHGSSNVEQSESRGVSPVLLGSVCGGRVSVSYEPEKEEAVIAHVVNPVTAFFCSSCGTCTARNVVTGQPNTCPSCSAVFEEMPFLPPRPSRLDSHLFDEVEVVENNNSLLRELNASEAFSGAVKRKCTKTTATMMTATEVGMEKGADNITNDANLSTMTTTAVTECTQTDAKCGLKPLTEVARHGLYFLHLWDQVTAHQN